jgi:ribosomal protein L12E/L44/L45/RPP1/RPP2
MKYVAAYALAVLSGKDHPTIEDLEHILSSVGANFDRVQAESLIKALAGKAIHEVIAAAQSKMGALPAGGAALPAAAAASAPAGAKEAKKEEKKEDKKEEEEADVALDLFGGGDEW